VRRHHPQEESGAASSSADPNAAAHGCYTQLHPKVQVAEGKGVNDCKDPKTAAEWAVLEKKQAKFVDTLAACESKSSLHLRLRPRPRPG